jgi:hypothetical protein
MQDGQTLIRYLEQSQVNSYGNGLNWGKYYQFLMHYKAEERRSIVEYAYSYQ